MDFKFLLYMTLILSPPLFGQSADVLERKQKYYAETISAYQDSLKVT